METLSKKNEENLQRTDKKRRRIKSWSLTKKQRYINRPKTELETETKEKMLKIQRGTVLVSGNRSDRKTTYNLE
jgi:hypothetical protein